jgi:type I restriction enzyme S subunit
VFPSLQAQRGIVKHLDRLLIDCRLLEALYSQKLAATAELKQSILQKAFSGQLTSAETVAA